MHLKSSLYDTLQFKAFQTQELSPKKSPLGQLVLKLINPATTNIGEFQTSTVNQPQIRMNQITKQFKNSYLEHWNIETKLQHKLECYRALKREYKLADYLSTVGDSKQRQILTKYRLSDHSLAIEKGRHKKWLPKEQRICGHCTTGEVETEMHFLLYCEKCENIRQNYFNKFKLNIPICFENWSNDGKLPIVLGEGRTAGLAGHFVAECHSRRDRERDTLWSL